MRKLGKCGQNLVEVAVMFALVVGVYAMMQVYIQRSFMARYKAGADYVHRELAKAAPAYAGAPRQYDQYYSESQVYDNSTYSSQKGYNSTGDFPNTVNDTFERTAWILTDIPGEDN